MAQVVIFTGASWNNPANALGSSKLKTNSPGTTSISRPLGAYQIAAILRNNGYTVQVIDHYWHLIPQAELFVDIFKKYVGPDTLWIGWSSTFFQVKGKDTSTNLIDHGYQSQVQACIGFTDRGINFIKRWISEQNPNIKLVCGGAQAWHWSKQSFEFFDYFVTGYADATALHLTDFLAGKTSSINTIKNLNGSQSIVYDQKGSLFDFNNHTHVWHESDYLHRGMSLPIEISRGCIFKCSYCSFPLNGKKKNDFIRDSGKLIDDLTYNYETFGTTHYMYADDTHNDSIQKLEYLYNNVYSKLSFKIKFSTYLRLDLLAAHPHMIELLKESGLVGTFFGVESFNKEANKVIGKTASKERIIENLWKCKDVWKDDVIINIGLILGLPNDGIDTCTEWLTESLHKDSPIDWAAIAPLQINPNGSNPLFQSDMDLDYKKYGYTFCDNSWTNNAGMTEYDANCLKEKFDIYQAEQNPCLRNWYDPHHAANLGITSEQFYNTSVTDLKFMENTLVHNYFNNLLKGI